MATAVWHDSRSGDFAVTAVRAPRPWSERPLPIGSPAPLDHKDAKLGNFETSGFPKDYACPESSTPVHYRPT